MAKRPTLIDITAGYGSNTQHNANNDEIETAFDNTLSRDGSTPNSMEADFDLNSNDILNGGTINADDIVIDGTSLQAQVDAAAASATAAQTAETNAETAEANAEAALDSFDDRYLGSKSSDPTLDNDGDALQEGALYWNSTSNELKVYNGSSWESIGGTTTFLGLTDTPNSFSGDGEKVLRVNTAEDAVEFVTLSGSEPSDGDKGDITVTSSGTVWSIDDDVIGTAHLADEDWGDFTISAGVATIDNNAITTVKINDDAVTLVKIADAALSGSDATLVTGTAGTTDSTAKWNADGDLVDGYPVLDEDNMSSDSNTSLATQQSIKAYVDANSGAAFTWLSQSTGGGVTSVDVTSIGSASEVVILFDEVNCDADSYFLVQLGDSGGVETTGYVGSSFNHNDTQTDTSGFPVRSGTSEVTGTMTLHNPTGNLWTQTHGQNRGSGGGSKTLSGTLDRLRLQRVTSGNFQGGTVYVGYR